MRYAAVRGPDDVSVVDAKSPVPAPGDIVVGMAACGICGSDLEKVYGQYSQPSTRLGHEPAGVVKAVGEGVEDFEPGDRVFTHHHVPCYDCYLCRHGNETRCPRYSASNLSPCGLADEYLVPAWNVVRGGVLKLSDRISFEQAAMIEPLACCVRAWSKLDFMPGDSAAIFGVGSTGMMHAMLAVRNGFENIFCVDTNKFRLDFVGNLISADAILADDATSDKIRDRAGHGGADIAIVATGSMGALHSAISSVRYGGDVMMFGVPPKNALTRLDMEYIYTREITLYNSYAASDRDTEKALELIEGGLEVERLITHRYDVADSPAAFERARSGSDAVKIVINGAG